MKASGTQPYRKEYKDVEMTGNIVEDPDVKQRQLLDEMKKLRHRCVERQQYELASMALDITKRIENGEL